MLVSPFLLMRDCMKRHLQYIFISVAQSAYVFHVTECVLAPAHSANVGQEVLEPRSDVISCRSLNLNGCRSMPGIDAALAALTALDSLSELSLQVRY